MRNPLAYIMTLGAVVVSTTALSIRDSFAERIHEPALILEEDGGYHLSHETYDHHPEIEGLPQLDFNTYSSQIFWLIIIFSILYLFFSKKTLRDASSIVEGRRSQIDGDLDNASRLREEAHEAQANYEAVLASARDSATELLKNSDDSIKALSAQRLDAFKERSAKLGQDTEREVQKAKEKIFDETQGVAAEIASIAAEKIVGVSTDLEHAKTLVKNISQKAV